MERKLIHNEDGGLVVENPDGFLVCDVCKAVLGKINA